MSVGQLPEVAPDFTLEHVLGHEVSLGDFRGRKVVVVFGGRESAPQVDNGFKEIRRAYGPDQLALIGISDLRAAPPQARIIAKTQMKKAFEEALTAVKSSESAAGREPPADPAQAVVMVMDWSGEVVDSFGLSGVEREAVGVVVDEDGRILGSGSGAALGTDVLAVVGSL
jgi:AhpC/TSA family